MDTDRTPTPPGDDWSPVVAVPELGPDAEILPGLTLPTWVLLRVDLPDYPELTLHVRVVYDEESRLYEPQEISIKTPAGAPEILRSIPLRSIVEDAMFCVVSIIANAPNTSDRWREYPPGNVFSAFRHPINYHLSPRLEEGGPTDENLRTIARIYRYYRLVGAPPTKLIQEILNLPRSTATRWISAARKKGLLDADEIGRGGGAQSRYGSVRG